MKMRRSFLVIAVGLMCSVCMFAQSSEAETEAECNVWVEISATADPGYEFDHWQDGNTEATRRILVESDLDVLEYTAYFRPMTLRIIGLANDEMMGHVDGAGEGEVGTTMTITAVAANKCYRFKQWSDGVTTAEREVTVGPTQEANTYTAEFENVSFQLKVNAGEHGSVTIETL